MMFLQATRVVPVHLAAAQHRLRGYLHLSGDLGGDAVAAFNEGRAVLGAGPGWLYKQVLLQSLRPFVDGYATIVQLRWVATGPTTSLVPIMDANLELRASDADGSRLTFHGSYRPPLGKVGAVVDQALLHIVAQATADAFLTRVASALSNPGAAQDATTAEAAATAPPWFP